MWMRPSRRKSEFAQGQHLSGSEPVRAQQGRDHVAGDDDDGGGVDQLNDHGSDPPQADGVERVDQQNGNAAADVNQVGHGRSRSMASAEAPSWIIGPGRINSRRGRSRAGVRNP
jgi:hypothetical protein